MSDLIRRKKIRDYIKGEINPYGKPFEGTAYELGLKIIRYIDAMDSAYDIDRVVEELETDSSVRLYGSGNSNNYLIPLEKTIEIVKAGGSIELPEHSKSQGDREKELYRAEIWKINSGVQSR